MDRIVQVGETDTLKTRVYFHVLLLAGPPALGEVGGQPQLSVNGAGFSATGISVLSVVGFGDYYAQLSPSILIAAGDIIVTRYSSGLTQESRGDVFQVVDNAFTAANSTIAVVDYYGTLAEANKFMASRLSDRAWVAASPDEKIQAMRVATQAIDRLNIAGLKQEDSQFLQFPRRNDAITNDSTTLVQTFSTEVPADIRFATYLCAAKFLSGWDADREIENLAATENRYAGASTKYDRTWSLDHIRAGIPSAQAWQMIRPYLRDPNELTLSRSS